MKVFHPSFSFYNKTPQGAPDKSERRSKLQTLKDLFIIAVMGQRFESVVSYLKSLKGSKTKDKKVLTV